jgi:hypothetical protein
VYPHAGGASFRWRNFYDQAVAALEESASSPLVPVLKQPFLDYWGGIPRMCPVVPLAGGWRGAFELPKVPKGATVIPFNSYWTDVDAAFRDAGWHVGPENRAGLYSYRTLVPPERGLVDKVDVQAHAKRAAVSFVVLRLGLEAQRVMRGVARCAPARR